MSEEETAEKREVKVEIISVFVTHSLNPAEFGKKYYTIIARAETGELITVRIPEEEYSEEKLKEAIKKELEKIQGIRGRTLTVEL